MAASLEKSLRARRSILLFGPRQTGKTTLIKEVCARFRGCLEYPLQLPSVRTKLETNPETLRREVAAAKSREPVLVFIDEIQKVPSIMDVLQYLIDEKQVILIATGSSARKLRHGHTNWLPGRVRVEHLPPLTWKEHGLVRPDGCDAAIFEDRLLYGGLPGVLAQGRTQRAEDLHSYAALYLEEEIRKEAVVRRLAPFARFLQLAALESGSSPNMSKLAGDVGVSHTTIREYFQILEDSLIVHRLSPGGKGRSAVLRKAKYYFFDIGVRNAAAAIGHDQGLLTLQKGILFEHHVILEALAQRTQARFSYWRNKKGREVDLVVERGSEVTAIEIKATAKPGDSDFAGLAAFRAEEKCDRAYLVCQVERPQRFQHAIALPWWQLDSIWK
ncbi:MAG: ATP-binding protein [Elusimicrobia bacterium]|nr:ATP-binding protein [Elusimicrobiota bacterium]